MCCGGITIRNNMFKVSVFFVIGFLILDNAHQLGLESPNTECYRRGCDCLPKWFLTHMGLDPLADLKNLESWLTIQLVSEQHLASFGDSPPDCSSQRDVSDCANEVIRQHCTEENIYTTTVESYLHFYLKLCGHVNCLMSATDCLNSLETVEERCERKHCLTDSMEHCASVSSEIVDEVKTVMNAELLACQQKECFAYLSSITTGTCSLLHSENSDLVDLTQDGLSAGEVCQAVPDIVHCALHTPDICLSLLDALLEGFGLNILLMTEVKEILQNPSNRQFADVYFNVFFSTQSCTGCLEGIFSCLPEFSFSNPLKVCGHMDNVQSCVEHNVPMCSHIFPTSFRPAFQNALPDLIKFARWLCGVVTFEATSCYVQSLECLGLSSANRSHVAVGFGALLDLFMSLEAGQMNDAFSALCIDVADRPPCLEEVYRSCEESNTADFRQQLMVLDQVMGLVCWLLNGDYSFDSLGALSWFSEIDLNKAWQELDDFMFDNAGLASYCIHLQLTFDAEWHGEYSNMSYTQTAMLKQNLENTLKQIFEGREPFMNPIVQFFLEGSIVSDLLLVSIRMLTPFDKVEQVRFLLKEISLSNVMLQIVGERYEVVELAVGTEGTKDSSLVSVLYSDDACLLYRVFTVCEHGICIPNDNSPLCRCEYDYEGEFCTEQVSTDGIQNIFLWAVLVTLLIAVPVILIVVFCIKYRGVLDDRNTTKKESEEAEVLALEQTDRGESLLVTPSVSEPVYQQVLYIHCTEDSNNNLHCTTAYNTNTTK